MPNERDIIWTGDPICYKRPMGSALVVGRLHYLFDIEGRLVSAQPVTRPVLAMLLQNLYKDHALAMAANIKIVPEQSHLDVPVEEPAEEAASDE
jgi:hypothetical protein